MSDDLTHAVRLRKEGRAEKARAILLELVNERPDDPQVHYQCAWVLLQTLAETSADEKISAYKEAILFYAGRLDETWG